MFLITHEQQYLMFLLVYYSLNLRGSNTSIVRQFETSLLGMYDLAKISIQGLSDIAGGVFQSIFIRSAYDNMVWLKLQRWISKFIATAISITYGVAAGVYTLLAVNATKSICYARPCFYTK